MRFIFLGDVVGKPGRRGILTAAAELRAEFAADAVVINAENAASGKGLTPHIAQEFLDAGIDVITLGDHAWDRKELLPWLETAPQVLRPLNWEEGTPGFGSYLAPTPAGPLGVLVLQTRTFMRVGALNPFRVGRAEVERLRAAGAVAVLVDAHGETTSEKIALGLHLDGLATAVLGTHTHVQTNDARILPGGTACVTDVGMCGPRDAVLGRDGNAVVQAFLTGLPQRLEVAGGPVMLSGAVITADDATGRATDIQLLNRVYE